LVKDSLFWAEKCATITDVPMVIGLGLVALIVPLVLGPKLRIAINANTVERKTNEHD
jgi:hypothetical protein